jgi:hypothetical protein
MKRAHKETTPGGEETTPGGEEKTPGGKEKTPGGKEKTPGGEEKTPGGEEKTPESGEKKKKKKKQRTTVGNSVAQVIGYIYRKHVVVYLVRYHDGTEKWVSADELHSCAGLVAAFWSSSGCVITRFNPRTGHGVYITSWGIIPPEVVHTYLKPAAVKFWQEGATLNMPPTFAASICPHEEERTDVRTSEDGRLKTGFVSNSPFQRFWVVDGKPEAEAWDKWFGFVRCVKSQFAGLLPTGFYLSYVNHSPSVLGGQAMFQVKMDTDPNPYAFTAEEDLLAFLQDEDLSDAFNALAEKWRQRIPPGSWHELQRPESGVRSSAPAKPLRGSEDP